MPKTTFTTPATWNYKELPGSDKFNQQIRDNIAALKERTPVGEIKFIGYEGIPDGPFLACDGSAYSRATYAALFAKIGTTWGAGDGTTTFNVPDARGRVLIGSGTGAGLTARTVGQSIGEESHLLTSSESGLPAHSHPIGLFGNGPSGSGWQWLGIGTSSYSSNNSAQDAASAHNNMQPSAVVKAIIVFE